MFTRKTTLNDLINMGLPLNTPIEQMFYTDGTYVSIYDETTLLAYLHRAGVYIPKEVAERANETL